MTKTNILIALAALCLVAWAVEHPPVATECIDCTAEPGPARSLADGQQAVPGRRPSTPGPLWEPLAEMTPAERANAEIWIEPGTDARVGARAEAKEISRLWNSGQYEAAIERARDFERFASLEPAAVAVSWRTPLEPDPELDWGPDIRIGTRDSLFGCTFDRTRTGWLFAAFPCRDSNLTAYYSYRSTNNGTTWSELAYVYWGAPNYMRAWSAACHGDYFQVSWVNPGSGSNRCWTGRLSTTTGNWVRFPGDSLAVIGIQSAAGDTFVELAVASAEDINPGSRIYLFGRTVGGVLHYAWTDSSCRNWRRKNLNITTCDNGLDCAVNQGYDSKFLWATWLRHFTPDTARLAYGYWTSDDTLFHSSYFSNVYSNVRTNLRPTAVTLYNDTIQMGFLGHGGDHIRHVYRYDCDSGTWYQGVLTDSLRTRDIVEVTGRRGGGFAVAYRNYTGSTSRHVLFKHAARIQGPYTDPDTVSENRPHSATRIRLERLSPGVYGAVWVGWFDDPYCAAWFDRVTLTGIAEPRPARPTPMGLRALPAEAGVRLAFDNPAAGPVRLRVFDLTGRLVLRRESWLPAGRQELALAPEASGVLFALVEADDRRATAKFAFTK